MIKKPLVVYHYGCSDGFAAALSFWLQYGNLYEYKGGIYQKEQEMDFSERDVYLVDFSYPRETLEKILEVADSVTVLDHHTSALAMLSELEHPKLNKKYCTTETSGAIIAWNFVKQKTKHNRKLPELFLHIADRDMWKFNLQGTEEITAALYTYNMEFSIWEALLDEKEALYQEGKTLIRKFKSDVERLKKITRRTMVIGEYTIPVFNVPSMFVSDLCNQVVIEENIPFAAGYYDTAEQRVFSLRSINEFNVANIARIYGGGGHLNAAGFSVPRDHILARS